MNDIEMEKLYRDMASRYAEVYGTRLKQELDELESSGIGMTTPEFDKRVRGAVRTRKRAPIIWGAAAAACVLLLTLLPGILRPATTPAPDPIQEYEIIPLGFSLPESFSVTEVAQDIEKTVYYLTDGNQEGVVMTLEKASGFMPNGDLERMDINHKQAYGLVAQDYSILMLEDNGILYTMTSDRDIAPLLELGGCI